MINENKVYELKSESLNFKIFPSSKYGALKFVLQFRQVTVVRLFGFHNFYSISIVAPWPVPWGSTSFRLWDLKSGVWSLESGFVSLELSIHELQFACEH